MTSKTSFFNKGIFLATLRRYIWGSVLYFVMLFLSVAMVILLTVDVDTNIYLLMSANKPPLIFRTDYFLIPILVSLFVPTVVALLSFRFVHSKKTAIFVHSLPVSRTANYVSTILADFVLMAVPVVLNGVILMLISLCGYDGFFDIAACFGWMGLILLILFLMFSVSTVASMITGNSFAMAGLNALIHGIMPALAACFTALANVFVFGYTGANLFLDKTIKWNFVGYLFQIVNDLYDIGAGKQSFLWGMMFAMIGFAAVLYILGWGLYKKRRMEAAEEVAAFKILNPTYKYILSFMAALGSFSVLYQYVGENPVMVTGVMFLTALVVYVAAEMILKKTFKIWNSYKGYLALCGVLTVVISVFAFTDFFGYETRVPLADQVESVAVYEHYSQADEPFVEDRSFVDYAISVHGDMVKKDRIYTVKPFGRVDCTAINFSYKLTNGKTITRRYLISEEEAFDINEVLFKWDEYKLKSINLLSPDIERVYSLNINSSDIEITDRETIDEIMACVKADILDLDYSQMQNYNQWGIHLATEIRYKGRDEVEYFGHFINANYKRTMGWIIANGYDHNTFNRGGYAMCILTSEQWKLVNPEIDYENFDSMKTVAISKEAGKFTESLGAERITDSVEKTKIGDFLKHCEYRYSPYKEYKYYICRIMDENYLEIEAALYEKEGKELLKLLGK